MLLPLLRFFTAGNLLSVFSFLLDSVKTLPCFLHTMIYFFRPTCYGLNMVPPSANNNNNKNLLLEFNPHCEGGNLICLWGLQVGHLRGA